MSHPEAWSGDIELASPGGGIVRYATDANGNVLILGPTGRFLGSKLGASNITYDSQNRVATQNGWTLAYDSVGRLASQTYGTQTQTFNYDSAGRYTGITES